MSKNKIYTSTDQRIFQGDFPISQELNHYQMEYNY